MRTSSSQVSHASTTGSGSSRNMDPDFDIERVATTMRNIFIEALSGRGQRNVVGRGTAMTSSQAESVGTRKVVEYLSCNETVPFKRGCPTERKDRHKAHDSKKTVDRAGVPAGRSTKKRWCAHHNLTTRTEEDCKAHGREERKPTGAGLYQVDERWQRSLC